MSQRGDSAVIIGVYGKGNFGDEALLEAVVEDVRSLLPGCLIHVFCSNPMGVTDRFDYHAVTRTPITGFLEKLAIVRKSRIVVVGGGTLLCDHGDPLSNSIAVITYFFWLWLARLFRVPTVAYAQGFGPAESRITRFGMWLIRLSCSAVTVRDKASYQLLVNAAGSQPHFALGADPVVASERFLPGRVSASVSEALAAEVLSLQPFVLLAVRYPKLDQPEAFQDYFSAFAETAAKLCLNAKARVVLFPTHLSDRFIDDRPIMDLIEPMLIEQGVSKSDIFRASWRSLDDAAFWLQSAGLVFGDRLHALLVAALNSVPVAGVAVENKIPGCLSDIFGDSLVAARLEPGDLGTESSAKAVVRLWDERESSDSIYANMLAAYRTRHSANITALSRVLK